MYVCMHNHTHHKDTHAWTHTHTLHTYTHIHTYTHTEWLETAADREARLEKRRLAEEKLEETTREKKAALERMCRELVVELFVDQVYF